MARESNRDDEPRSRGIPRRDFLKLATAGAAGLLIGCSQARQPDVAPTGEPTAAPTSVPAPTLTSTPAPTPTPVHRPEIIRFYPDVPSKVVHTHHAGVWAGVPQGGTEDNDLLVPEALREMLDFSIAELTGLDDPAEAWAALFAPDERIAIKVNAIQGATRFWTHAPLVLAVTECLQDVGVGAEQIVVFDNTVYELRRAGYLDVFESGVRCQGSSDEWGYDEGVWTVAGEMQVLSRIVYDCDALINMPILKAHPETGITFAMKNHFGTINMPAIYHREDVDIELGVAELNALPPIKDRTRLFVGDALSIADNPANWNTGLVGDSIFVSFDPVAHEAAGLQLLAERMAAEERDTAATVEMANRCLAYGAELGLGTNDPLETEHVEINLG